MSSDKDEKTNQIKISDDVIAICAATATLKTSGVADLSSGFSDTISKNILGREPLYTGIKVEQKDDGIGIDVYAEVVYGAKIPEVAWDIQENVKNAVAETTGLAVKLVNIHIQRVRAMEDQNDQI